MGGPKNFFAFLDELGHSEYFLKKKKKVWKMDLTPPPVKKYGKFHTFYFFSTLKASLSGLILQYLNDTTFIID